VRVSIASPLMQPSPNGRRVGIRIVTFEACSGFTRITARRIAQPPKATFVTRLRPFRSPGRAARQLPDQSTTLRVESSSTGDPRLRGALPTADILIAKKEGSSFLEPLILAGATAVQLARARGLTVIGTAGTERGRKLVLSEGAHHVLDHTAPGYLDECVRLSEPRPRTNVEEQVLRHDTEIEP
jgi:hypothetical protein